MLDEDDDSHEEELNQSLHGRLRVSTNLPDAIDQLLDESIETDRNTLILADLGQNDDVGLNNGDDDDFDLVYMSDLIKN